MNLRPEIDEAIHAHAVWKTKFHDFLAGKEGLDIPHISECKRCGMGKWLEDDGKKHLSQADYEMAHQLHAAFHDVAARIVHKIKRRYISGALADLAPGGTFDEASTRFCQHLLKIALHCQTAVARN